MITIAMIDTSQSGSPPKPPQSGDAP